MNAIPITETGAVGDGATLCTAAIQAAIDAAAAPGGCGRVVVPRGRFLTGTVFLRSGLVLELLPGAVLLGSPNLGDYAVMQAGAHKDLQPYHLLVLDGLQDVTVCGPGCIDGGGPAFWQPEPLPSGWFRELGPRPSPMIECVDCRGLTWRDVRIANSPGWTLHFKRCTDVRVDGVSIRNNLFGPNTDGIDINGCSDVRVSGCLIEAGDDAIVLKTTPDSRPCERVTVTNCTIATSCRALKLGAHESYHDMRDVAFSNCVVSRSVAVVGLYCRNGGTLENIVASNIVGHAFANPDYNQPIHIDLGLRDGRDRLGRIRNVALADMVLHSNGRVLVTGHPRQPLENVSLRGIQLHLAGVHDPHPGGLTAGGNQFSPSAPPARAARAAVVVENARQLEVAGVRVFWPPDMPAPFHGFWGRNVRGGRVSLAGLPASDGSIPPASLEDCDLQLPET